MAIEIGFFAAVFIGFGVLITYMEINHAKLDK